MCVCSINLYVCVHRSRREEMDSGVKTLSPSGGGPMKKENPWGRHPQPSPAVCSLATVMDEELARKFQKEEEEECSK